MSINTTHKYPKCFSAFNIRMMRESKADLQQLWWELNFVSPVTESLLYCGWANSVSLIFGLWGTSAALCLWRRKDQAPTHCFALCTSTMILLAKISSKWFFFPSVGISYEHLGSIWYVIEGGWASCPLLVLLVGIFWARPPSGRSQHLVQFVSPSAKLFVDSFRRLFEVLPLGAFYFPT